jgi:hypothetical protein
MECIADEIQTGTPEAKPLLPAAYHESESPSSEISTLPSCRLAPVEEDTVDISKISTETPARSRLAGAGGVDAHAAVKTTMRPMSRALLTSQMAEHWSRSDSLDHLTGPRTTSERVQTEKTQNNLQLGHASVAGADDGVESDVESCKRSTDDLSRAREGSSPGSETKAIVDRTHRLHDGMMQQRPQHVSNDNDRILQLFLAEATDFLTEKGGSDDIGNADTDLQTTIDTTASETSSEILGHSDVEIAVEDYSVVRNGRKNHYIIRQDKNVPRWTDLAFLPHVDYRGARYKAGDIVYILLADGNEDSCAKIREIRDLMDGRMVISVLWYFTIKDVKRYGCTTLKEWPRGKSHMLSNMLQVTMWDTINGLVEETLLGRFASGKILDIGTKSCRILNNGAKAVAWVNELPEACRVQE